MAFSNERDALIAEQPPITVTESNVFTVTDSNVSAIDSARMVRFPTIHDPGTMNVKAAMLGGGSGSCETSPDEQVGEDMPEKQTATLPSPREVCWDALVALFTVCLGATDGLSLGSLFFPSSKEHPNEQYRSLGMSLGLLTSFAANVILASQSQMPFSVGGMIATTVPVLQEYFTDHIGAEYPETVIVLIPLLTMSFGVAVVILGKLKLGAAVEHCPFPVYAGFIAGSGLQLIECGLGMMCDDFHTFAELGSWQALACNHSAMNVSLGTMGAMFCFLIPRWDTKWRPSFLDWKVALAACITIECCVVYGAIWCQGMTTMQAIDQGWLFRLSEEPAIKLPTSIWSKEWFWSFKRGTVRWDKVCYCKTLLTYLQVVMLGFLTVTKSIVGLAACTKSKINIDVEITKNGFVNILSGCIGATPGTTVMSYSFTASSFGVGRSFKFFIVIWSAALFFLGDYIAASVPKVVPAGILVWLGLQLLIPFVWDLMGRCPHLEYGVIVAMVFIDMFMGCGFMLVSGLCLTLIQTTLTVIQTNKVETYTLDRVHSNVLRPIIDHWCLRDMGKQTLVVRFERGYVAFWVVGQIRNAIDNFRRNKIDHVVLDMEVVSGVSIGALNYFKELIDTAHHHRFHVIFALPEKMEEQLVKDMRGFQDYYKSGPFIHDVCLGQKVSECHTNDRGELLGSPIVFKRDLWRHGQEDHKKDGFRASDMAYIKLDEHNENDAGGAFLAGDVMSALELCENSVLRAFFLRQERAPSPSNRSPSIHTLSKMEEYYSCTGPCSETLETIPTREASRASFFRRAHRGIFSIDDVPEESSPDDDSNGRKEIDCVCRNIKQVLMDADTQARFNGDVDTALRKLFDEEFFVMKRYDAGTCIYEGTREELKNGKNIPAIYWLIQGEIIHTFEDIHGERQKVEKAQMGKAESVLECVGPFSTHQSFRAEAVHVGELRAVRHSKVVELSYQKYMELLEEHPKVAHAVNVYLQRIRSRVNIPRKQYQNSVIADPDKEAFNLVRTESY